MGAPRFDVVVVGARCAGASLACRLAAAGASVAVLDAAPLPSGQPTSTHLIQPPGMDELDALGLGDRVRELTPALEALRLAYDGREARLRFGPGRAAHCLRRETLDRLLQDAAARAGATLMPRTRVVDVLRAHDGRVRGVEARVTGGGALRLDADLVVGADGRNSTLAKLVGAREYLGYDGPRACYWAYWRRPPAWDPHELHNHFAGRDAHVVFPTDGDLLLIGAVPTVERAREWRGNHAEEYLASVRACGAIGPFLGDDAPESRVRGVLRMRYWFRESAGPGWALIGDAGHHKEFVLGLGISDALRDGRALADAVVDGDPAAVRRWWRRRDVERVELFHWGRELGSAEPVTAMQRLIASGLAAEPELGLRLGAVIDGRLSPFDLVPASRTVRWLAAALMRGDTAPLGDLPAAVRRRARARWELRRRRMLARSPEPLPCGRGSATGRTRSSAPRRPAARRASPAWREPARRR